MPANKNQHFVPRCYLRAFSWGGDGKAIDLYNIARRKIILGAPVKNQCARDYLYCKDDPRLEQVLKLMEDDYASNIRVLDNSADRFSDLVGHQLRSFMMRQYFRTEAAMRRVETAFAGTSAAITRATGQPAPTVAGDAREMMLESLGMFARSADCINDLHVCILDNATGTDFVASDDPVCMTSRCSGVQRPPAPQRAPEHLLRSHYRRRPHRARGRRRVSPTPGRPNEFRHLRETLDIRARSRTLSPTRARRESR